MIKLYSKINCGLGPDYKEMVKGRIQIAWKCHGCDTQVGIVAKYVIPKCFI